MWSGSARGRGIETPGWGRCQSRPDLAADALGVPAELAVVLVRRGGLPRYPAGDADRAYSRRAVGQRLGDGCGKRAAVERLDDDHVRGVGRLASQCASVQWPD